MFEAKRYTISIQYAEFDGEGLYEATVREFPDLVVYGESHNEAYEDVISVIEDACEHLLEQGQVPPEPMQKAELKSGRIPLRVPRSLHTTISDLAEAEGISLNQFLVFVISSYVGGQSALQAMREPSGLERALTATSSKTYFANWSILPKGPYEASIFGQVGMAEEPIYMTYIEAPTSMGAVAGVGLTEYAGRKFS